PTSGALPGPGSGGGTGSSPRQSLLGERGYTGLRADPISPVPRQASAVEAGAWETFPAAPPVPRKPGVRSTTPQPKDNQAATYFYSSRADGQPPCADVRPVRHSARRRTRRFG